MTYWEARKLLKEDEIIIKETREHLTVMRTFKPHPDHEIIIIECDDGNIYHNSEVEKC